MDRYLKFHQDCPELMVATPEEIHTVTTIVDKKLDALGIEPWLRKGTNRHLLTRKLMLIAYLTECDAEYYKYWRGSPERSIWYLLLDCIRAGFQLSKGLVQKALYGLL
jgi:hypothetical protein